MPGPKDVSKMIDLFKKYVPWKWLVYIRPSFLTLVPDDLKTQELCNEAFKKAPWLLFDKPDCFRSLRMSIRAIQPLKRIPPDNPKTQGVCERTAEKDPWQLKDVPDHFKMQDMRNKAVCRRLGALKCVPDRFKTQKMCINVVEVNTYALGDVPDHLKIQGIGDRTVKDDSSSLQFVPDWFVIREWVDMWYDDYYDDDGGHWDDDDHDEDRFLELYDGCKKQKAQKSKIREELSPIAWRPSRWRDLCMSEDEKKETENLWA